MSRFQSFEQIRTRPAHAAPIAQHMAVLPRSLILLDQTWLSTLCDQGHQQGLLVNGPYHPLVSCWSSSVASLPSCFTSSSEKLKSLSAAVQTIQVLQGDWFHHGLNVNSSKPAEINLAPFQIVASSSRKLPFTSTLMCLVASDSGMTSQP